MKFTEQEKYDICMTSCVLGGWSLGLILLAINIISYLFAGQTLHMPNLVIGSVLLSGGIITSRIILKHFRKMNGGSQSHESESTK